jgi:hypothetical protein
MPSIKQLLEAEQAIGHQVQAEQLELQQRSSRVDVTTCDQEGRLGAEPSSVSEPSTSGTRGSRPGAQVACCPTRAGAP